MAYYSLNGQTVTQKIIEKSRFITTSRHVRGEEEARAFIAELREKYRDATHNCYAYIADNLGNFPRFSDDGEPQGTAGMPILDVLKNNDLRETAVVVTRYFGGIKLGAGGLVRAYSGCCAENIAAAQKVVYETCSEMLLAVSYPDCEAAQRFFNACGINVISAEYSNEVNFIVAVKKTEEERFTADLLNLLCGRLYHEKLREYYSPFAI